LICVGTEGGSIYVYGDGFQYMRPWLTNEPNEVVSIVALHPNRIIVAFGDNSLVVMELPTLEVIDLLPPSWLSSHRCGDITAIHCDAPSEKNFVYVGTSEGYLTVLDVMESAVRICDFELNLTDFGLQGQSLSISDIESCPKDERYLAVGFDGVDNGAIVVYDLVKHKILKQFQTHGISALQWHQAGEVLFAGISSVFFVLVPP
jgi:WD40 repeat protein